MIVIKAKIFGNKILIMNYKKYKEILKDYKN